MKKRLLAAVFAAFMMVSLTACGSEPTSTDNNDAASASEEQQSSVVSEAVDEAKTLDDLIAALNESIADTEVGSTARADAIAMQAKADAKNATEDIGNAATVYIAETYPDFYDSTEIMEKVMYCGYYLEYSDFGDAVSQLGQDVEQAVKYVYRGAESAEDEATQENLDQIKKVLEPAGLI